MITIKINPPLDDVFCLKCGAIKESCICVIKTEHIEGCLYLRAARLSIELPCKHGFQACHICDPCSCGIEVKDLR